MASGEGDIEAANPPPDLEGEGTAIGAKGEETEEEAEAEPTEEHQERGLQKDGLRLSKLFDRIERENSSRKGQSRAVVDAGAQHQRGAVLGEEGAAVGGRIEEVTGVAGAQSCVVGKGMRRACHSIVQLAIITQSRKNQPVAWICGFREREVAYQRGTKKD